MEIAALIDELKPALGYDDILSNFPERKEAIDLLFALIAEAEFQSEPVVVGTDTIRAAEYREALISTEEYHIRYILQCLEKTAPTIRNKRSYLQRCLLTIEMNDKSSRPAIVTGDVDVSGFDTILLGFPIWWYIAPTIINSFLEAYDFSGKTIVLFATSGGSGFGDAVSGLQPSAPGATIKEGKLLNGHQTVESLKEWAETV